MVQRLRLAARAARKRLYCARTNRSAGLRAEELLNCPVATVNLEDFIDRLEIPEDQQVAQCLSQQATSLGAVGWRFLESSKLTPPRTHAQRSADACRCSFENISKHAYDMRCYLH